MLKSMTSQPTPITPPQPRKWIGSGEDCPIGDELKDLIPIKEEEYADLLH